MIRPWYRSRLFWLGVPGLLFLIWAWSDSSSQFSMLSRFGPAEADGCFHWQGGLVVFHASLSNDDIPTLLLERSTFVVKPNRPGYTLVGSVPKWRFERTEWGKFDSKCSPRPAMEKGSLAGGSRWWSVFLPHWLIAIFYLVVWFGTLAGWQRRKSRLLELHAAPPP